MMATLATHRIDAKALDGLDLARIPLERLEEALPLGGCDGDVVVVEEIQLLAELRVHKAENGGFGVAGEIPAGTNRFNGRDTLESALLRIREGGASWGVLMCEEVRVIGRYMLRQNADGSGRLEAM